MPFLDWVNKNQAKESVSEVPYHLLKQEATYGEPSENLLIQGDNLLALKALIPLYAGQVKCIFIDPPYNTQSAFEHYDDKLEHSQWLSMMYPRLVLLRELLSEDGSIWITLDDREAHYFKVLMDEVFGRKNFIANVIWQKKYSPQNDAEFFSAMHDHVLVYSRNASQWKRKLIPRSSKQDKAYKNPDNDIRGSWKPSDLTRPEHRDRDFYPIVTPSGKEVYPSRGRSWSRPLDEIERLRRDGRLWFGKNGDAIPSLKRFLSEVQDGVVPQTIWLREEVGDNQDAKKEIKKLNPQDIFATPKPEALITRVLSIATDVGDIVLDSFLGSGTTAAVAHKMGRQYIGIEMGDHARTHCIPRLQKVIEGEQGGISKDVSWQGGGGFRFCTLGEPVFDEDGCINEAVDFSDLASFVWHFETGEPSTQQFNTPLLGVHNGTAYYLLFKDVLGNKKPASGNVLTRGVLHFIKSSFPHDGPIVIYGDTTRLGEAALTADGVTFKQIPYDVKVR